MRSEWYTLFFLLFTSTIMLVILVTPHRHHANDVICTKNNVTPEPQCPRHHHHPGNNPCYSDGCVTRFNSPILSVQADNNPHYLFTAILLTDLIIENLLKLQKRRIKNYYAHRESLHSTVINCAFSLRVPPYSVVQVHKPYLVRLEIY